VFFGFLFQESNGIGSRLAQLIGITFNWKWGKFFVSCLIMLRHVRWELSLVFCTCLNKIGKYMNSWRGQKYDPTITITVLDSISFIFDLVRFWVSFFSIWLAPFGNFRIIVSMLLPATHPH